jgi:hypothetical protein
MSSSHVAIACIATKYHGRVFEVRCPRLRQWVHVGPHVYRVHQPTHTIECPLPLEYDPFTYLIFPIYFNTFTVQGLHITVVMWQAYLLRLSSEQNRAAGSSGSSRSVERYYNCNYIIPAT